MRLCPVAVICALREHALAAGEHRVAQCEATNQLGRRFKHLFGRAKVQRCGRRLALGPWSVGPWPILNPEPLAGACAVAGSGGAANAGKHKGYRGA